jgi:hypothetical protein
MISIADKAVLKAKEKALKVLESDGPEAAIASFLESLREIPETASLGVFAQASSPMFEEHWRGGNDEHDENGLIDLWINQFSLPAPTY